MALHQIPSTRAEMSTPHIGFVAMTLLLCACALFMCASHSRRRKRWNECYGFFDEETVTVIELQNENAVIGDQIAYEDLEETVSNGEAVWKKNILMGGKCQLPDFSGVIIYDAEGNVVTPAKTPRLTWK
ncbi:hypothetical protein SAY87_020738 [Trapa incisa]|uniref:Transmembrane protein n=2 Tax=Trapa TaxID=22665 RepID=A0AAN7M746_TRANT|nr:hypothetical protein SAY87_020738 [Trapa incisa]KAK4804208.1 hypothetical protein SAY86_004025 [Trapa natans]